MSAALLLRPVREQDAEAIHRLLADGRVAPTTSTIPFPYHLADAQAWTRHAAATGQAPASLQYLLEQDGEPVGVISCMETASAIGNVAYWIAAERWGRGIASRALALLLARPEVRGHYLLLEGLHLDDNPASGAVLRRNGFEPVGDTERPWRGGAKRRLLRYRRAL